MCTSAVPSLHPFLPSFPIRSPIPVEFIHNPLAKKWRSVDRSNFNPVMNVCPPRVLLLTLFQSVPTE